ncbi:MAG: hypothetical protein J0I09_04380 [Sphingobacteriia bacterium]|nr:hypothetical protein [Sphingobacteriia bacterium]
MKKIIFTFLLILIFWKAQSQTTYYWVGGTNGASPFNVKTNWSSSSVGGAPVSGTGNISFTISDKLIFDGSNIGGGATGAITPTITNSISIGQLFIQNNATVTFQRTGSSGTSTFTLNGANTNNGTAPNPDIFNTPDFSIDATSTLTITSGTAGYNMIINLMTTAVGIVSGTLNLTDNGLAGSTSTRIYSQLSGGGLIFKSGSVCTSNVTATGNYPFGSSTSQSASKGVIFLSGSQLTFLGGNSIFGSSSSFQPIIFNPGSTVVFKATNTQTGMFSNRLYADVKVQNNATVNIDASVYNISNLTVDPGSTFNLNSSGVTPISGNITNNGTIGALLGSGSVNSTSNLAMIGENNTQTISGTGSFSTSTPIGALSVGALSNVILGMNISTGASTTSCSINGTLNLQTYSISGLSSFNAKNANSLSVTANINTDSFLVKNISNFSSIGVGMLVAGNGIQSNTIIIGTNPTNSTITLSKPVTGTYSYTDATLINLTISNNVATLITANTNGIDGCIATTGTRTFSSGVNYVFNAATVTPLPASGALTQANNITFNANVTLNNPLTVSGNVTVGSGSQLITGNNLTLSSTSSGTAAIAQGTGSYLSGNVTVQRYVGSSQHWRMVGFPFANGSTVAATTLSGFYTSNYRAYSFNETGDDGVNYGTSSTPNSGWQQFASGNLGQYQGLLLLGGTIVSTINFSGPLNIGTQNINLSKTVNGWNLISNPFASNITWSTIQAASTNVGSAVYRYNPNTTAYAAYNASTSTSSDGTQGNIIENGGSFFVQATGASPILKIQESDKTTTAASATLFDVKLPAQGNTIVFGAASASQESMIRLTVKNDNDQYGDAVVVRWGGNYAATDLFDIKYDAYDLGRLNGVDIAVVDTAGVKYSIFHGSALQAAQFERRKIKLSLTQVVEGNYTLSSQLLSPFAGNNIIYLYDSYTNVYVKLDENNPSYQFTVNTDPSSKNVNRFSLVFNNITDEKSSHSSQAYLLNNPSAGNGFYISFNKNFNTVQWQLLDVSGKSIQIGALQNVQSQEVYHVGLQKNIQGLFFIKLIGDGNALNTVKLVKQ